MDLQGFGHLLLSGAGVTLQLALTSLGFGLLFGILGALCKLSRIWLIRQAATLYTTIIRGIPELLLVLGIYFGGSMMLMGIASGLATTSILKSAHLQPVLRHCPSHLVRMQQKYSACRCWRFLRGNGNRQKPWACLTATRFYASFCHKFGASLCQGLAIYFRYCLRILRWFQWLAYQTLCAKRMLVLAPLTSLSLFILPQPFCIYP